MPLYTRREFAKLAAAALPAAGFFSSRSLFAAASPSTSPAAKPNSKVAGVQLGINVPYSFGSPAMTGEQVLAAVVQLGLSAVELRAQPVEQFLGFPPALVVPPKRVAGEKKKAGNADADAAAELKRLRLGASMDRARDFRQMYEDAGVLIQIMKVDNIYRMSDEELDYFFTLARTLGARAISCEISTKDDDLKRLGGFADKHEFPVGYHGHTKVSPATWENAFSFAKYNWANVDIGHFIAGNNYSPVPFIKQYHDRITHIHLKDRKLHDGPNVPFGEGDTPIAEVLHLLRDNHWPIQGTIEFEYKVPPGSDRMTEIAKAVTYCRAALA